MHRTLWIGCAIIMLGTAATRADAQTATQVVTFKVVPLSQIAVSAAPAPLLVSAATAGSAPTTASVSGASWGITTNELNQKVVAAIDAPMPSGMSLVVSLAAPAGAASTGATALGTTAADVVTGLSAISAAALPMVYTLTASPSASGGGTRVVTYTITSGQ